MRKILVFILACAFLIGGVYLIWGAVMITVGFPLRTVAAGGLLATIGGYLLWEDFILPLLGRK